MIGLLAVAALAAPTDVNRASASELDDLPGIGPAKAQAIVAWRAEHGPCATLDDLVDVPGIGAATVAMLRGRAICGAGSAVTGASTGVRTAPIARPLRVDVNRASVAELSELPGITEARAVAIVAERARGPYSSCADLARVPGIGPATIANLASTCVATAP